MNLPTEFKDFNKNFEQLARRYGYYDIWEDFLDLFINGFCFNHRIDLERIQSKYSKDERLKLGLLITEVIGILDNNITDDKSWFDFFGTFYESVSLSKQKGFAQFFTPPTICDFMAQIVSPERTETLSDPCCGSGRFSLASNKIHLGQWHFLVDLDYTCAKMASLNLMMHGIVGIVVCDDALFPASSFKGAFIINRKLHLTGIPQIEFVDCVNEAYNYVRLHTQKSTPVSKPSDKTIGVEKGQSKMESNDFEDIKEILNKTGQYEMEF